MSTTPSSLSEILYAIFKKKQGRNPSYSLRAYARDLGISPGRLSVILNNKDQPGQRFLDCITRSKILSQTEKQYLHEWFETL